MSSQVKIGLLLLILVLFVGCSPAAPAPAQPTTAPTTAPAQPTTAPTAASGQPTKAAAPTGKPILVGISTALSGSLSSLGQDYQEGTKLAVSEINAAGGILGRPLELRFADNACDPATGINAASKLIDVDQVSIMIDGTCSSVALAVMPVVQKAGMVEFVAGPTSPKITDGAGVGGNPWIYRLNINDDIMAKAFNPVIAKEVKTVAIVGRNDDFGRSAADIFQKGLQALGVKVLSADFVTTGTTDYRPLITKLKAEAPEGLIVIQDAPDAGPFAVQSAEMGWTNYKVYARGTVVSPEFQQLTKNPAIWNGAQSVGRWAPITGSKFAAAYKAMWGRDPRETAAMPYFGVYVIAEAIKIAGSDDRKGIRDALEKVNMTIPEIGPVKFDDHHQAHPDMFMNSWKDGNITPLSRVPSQ